MAASLLWGGRGTVEQGHFSFRTIQCQAGARRFGPHRQKQAAAECFIKLPQLGVRGRQRQRRRWRESVPLPRALLADASVQSTRQDRCAGTLAVNTHGSRFKSCFPSTETVPDFFPVPQTVVRINAVLTDPSCPQARREEAAVSKARPAKEEQRSHCW